jgi:hypothetical protein
MINSFSERRIPKRKDHFNLLILLYGILVVLPLGIIFIPGFFRYVEEYLSILFVFYFLVVGLGSTMYSWWRWRSKWEETANLLNLTYDTYKPHGLTLLPWPRISGSLRGCQVKVERFTKGSGRYKKIYTSIVLNFAEPLKEQIALSPRGLMSNIGEMFKGQNQELPEISTGNDDFDPAWLIKATSDYFAKSVFSSHAIRQGLLELKPQARDLSITIVARQLYFHERSSMTDPEYLAAVTNLLLDMADYARRYG